VSTLTGERHSQSGMTLCEGNNTLNKYIAPAAQAAMVEWPRQPEVIVVQGRWLLWVLSWELVSLSLLAW